LTTNSWDALRPKLAPNPQQYKLWPIMLGAMAVTVAGVALTSGSLMVLFGITGLPDTFEGVMKESTWRIILDIAALYVMASVISAGNSFFGLYRPAGYTFCLSGAFAFVVVARDLAIATAHFEMAAAVLEDWRTTVTLLVSFLAGARLLRVGNAGFARASRYGAQVVQHPSDLRGLDYIVYLRTFTLDSTLSGAQSFNRLKRALRGLFIIEPSEEVLVADALSSDRIPMVGVGRPGEAAPPVGALRFYLPQADWKPPVRELMQGARHVVLALGRGAGTIWELGEAMRVLAPEQLILVVPMEQTEYERIRRETANSLPAELPEFAGGEEIRSAIRGLITFSDGWKATFVPLRAYSPFHNSLRVALLFAAWPALRRLGYPPRGVLRWAPNLIQ
jgi:hypothetical protein